MVRNLSPEVDQAALAARFKRHGDIYTIKIASDSHQQWYGMVHYMDEASVSAAIHSEDGTLFLNTRISVAGHGEVPMSRQSPFPPSVSSSAEFPSLANGPSSGYGQQPSSHAAAAATTALQALEREQHAAAAVLPPPAMMYGGNGGGGSSGGAQPGTSLHRPLQPQLPLQLQLLQQQQQLQQQQPPLPAAIPLPSPQLLAPAGGGTGSAPPAPTAAPAGPMPAASPSPSPVLLGSEAGGVKLRAQVAALAASFERLSDMMCCPITHEVFQDPVVAADGHTYERAALAAWISKGGDAPTSPMTGQVLVHRNVLPNKLVRSLVQELA